MELLGKDLHVCDHGGQENLFSSFAPFVASNSVYLMVYDVSIPLEAEAQSSVRLNVEGDYQHLQVKLHHMKYNKDWIKHHLSAISVSSVSKHHQLADESRSESEEKLTNVRYKENKDVLIEFEEFVTQYLFFYFSNTESTGNAVVKSSTQGIGSVFDCVSPPAIFAATHADKIVGKEEEVMRKQDAVLNRMLRDKPYTGHVYRRPPESQSSLFKSELCFCIDNTKSHSPSRLSRIFRYWYTRISYLFVNNCHFVIDRRKEDPELVALRKLIISKVEQHCTQELIPVNWLLIEDKVYEIRDKSHDKIIPFLKLLQVGVEQCLMKSTIEVSDALSHLHNFSIVVYFSSSPILQHCVFIDAQWVFTSLSRLCPFHSKGLPANLQKDFDMLTKKGIMSQELANYFFRDLKDEDRSKMLEAAQLLDIVSKHQTSEQDIEYFVPSALREEYEVKIEVKSSSNDIPKVTSSLGCRSFVLNDTKTNILYMLKSAFLSLRCCTISDSLVRSVDVICRILKKLGNEDVAQFLSYSRPIGTCSFVLINQKQRSVSLSLARPKFAKPGVIFEEGVSCNVKREMIAAVSKVEGASTGSGSCRLEVTESRLQDRVQSVSNRRVTLDCSKHLPSHWNDNLLDFFDYPAFQEPEVTGLQRTSLKRTGLQVLAQSGLQQTDIQLPAGNTDLGQTRETGLSITGTTDSGLSFGKPRGARRLIFERS